MKFFKLFSQESKYTVLYVKNMDAYSKLPRGTKRTLEKLWQYELPLDITKRLKKKFPFNSMSDKEVATCIDEFKKFMAVMIIGRKKKKGVAMTSNVIDEIWHEFVLFTIEYQEFSNLLENKYIHHTPNTKTFSFGPDAAKFFFDTYKEYFGELHPIWYYTMVEHGEHEIFNSDGSSLLSVLSESQKGETEAIEYTTKYQLIKKRSGASPLPIKSTGSFQEKNSNYGACGGIFACGSYTTGYTASDGSGVGELGASGGFWDSFGGDGDGGGCGGCGGCGG